jgi:hypothetical protein
MTSENAEMTVRFRPQAAVRNDTAMLMLILKRLEQRRRNESKSDPSLGEFGRIEQRGCVW